MGGGGFRAAHPTEPATLKAEQTHPPTSETTTALTDSLAVSSGARTPAGPLVMKASDTCLAIMQADSSSRLSLTRKRALIPRENDTQPG
jgi:hypothetical protein